MVGAIPDVDFAVNPSERLPCVLVLDGSGSMGGIIKQLNDGVEKLATELKKDPLARKKVRILVIRIGGNDEVEILTDWTDAIDFVAPTIVADGVTPLGAGVRRALSELELEKQRYRKAGIAYNRPWLFLFTDGAPTDKDWTIAAAECVRAEQDKKVVVFPIAVEGADLSKLGAFTKARAPLVLEGAKFALMFEWLSSSLGRASQAAQGEAIQMPSPAGWATIPG